MEICNLRFYHIGTLPEYISAFCYDQPLRREMGFKNAVARKDNDTGNSNSDVTKCQGTVLACKLPRSLVVPEGVVLEYTIIEAEEVVYKCIADIFTKGCVLANFFF